MPELAIIGAGFAGLILADTLVTRGADPADLAVVDADDAARASDVPGALMHPFPGRSLEPKPDQFSLAEASIDYLRGLKEATDDAIVELPMARPLVGRLGESLRTSFEAMQGRFPAWFDARIARGAELGDIDPLLAQFDDVLVYTPAFSVDPGRVRRHLRERLEAAGVTFVDHTRVECVEQSAGRWTLWTSAEPVEAGSVVLALGFGLARWFPGLPIRGKGGEVLAVRPPKGAELGCVINASGHLAPLADGTWVAGSTYWSADELGGRDDDKAIAELLERCAPLAAPLADATPVRLGRGVRAAYRGDNRPLVGPVPGQPGLFVFGAFGSKGLFRIPRLARTLADHLLDAAEIDPRSTTARVKPAKWHLAPVGENCARD